MLLAVNSVHVSWALSPATLHSSPISLLFINKFIYSS